MILEEFNDILIKLINKTNDILNGNISVSFFNRNFRGYDNESKMHIHCI